MQRSPLLLAGTLFLFALLSAPCVMAADDPDAGRRFTEDDLPSLEKDPAGPSEIDEVAGRHGFRYARDTRRAARGDFKALKKFFEIAQEADGAAAEIIQGVPTVVYHLLGDEKFAKFLTPPADRVSDDGAESDPRPRNGKPGVSAGFSAVRPAPLSTRDDGLAFA